MDKINLVKKTYNKNQYKKVIDTNFSQLINTPSPSVITPTISVEEFFQNYNQIFFQIPKEGETNSHEYLIKTSSEYINFTPINEDIQALIEEINLLQRTNLELNQQLVDLQNTNNLTKAISSNPRSTLLTQITETQLTEAQIATRGRG